MKIALVSEFAFVNPQKGVELRLHQTAELLSEIGTVWPVVVTNYDTPPSRLSDLRKRFGSVTYLVPTEVPSRTILSKLRRLIDRRMIANRGCHIPICSRENLLPELQACDLVWIHSLKVADSLGAYDWQQGVLDLDDLYSEKFLQNANLVTGLADQLKNRWRAATWRRWERDGVRRFKRVIVCSEDDKRKLGGHPHIAAIPNTLEDDINAAVLRRPFPNRIGFVGTLEYSANLDAICWFIEQVLPLLVNKHPSIRFRILGQLPSDFVRIDHPNVDLLGYVDDLADEVATWSASVAPMRIGGGTRLKILDSFRRRCPVVSTTLGCYGLGVRDQVELLIGDSPESFATACLSLCFSPALGACLSEAAFQKWRAEYTFAAIRPAIRRIVEEVGAA